MKFNLFAAFSRKSKKSADEPVVTPVVSDSYQTQTVSPAADSSFGTVATNAAPQPIVNTENIISAPIEPAATPYSPVNQYQSTNPSSDATDVPVTTPQYTNITPTESVDASSPEVIADIVPQPTTSPDNNSPSSPTPTDQF